MLVSNAFLQHCATGDCNFGNLIPKNEVVDLGDAEWKRTHQQGSKRSQAEHKDIQRWGIECRFGVEVSC